jgi:hypothetical protein
MIKPRKSLFMKNRYTSDLVCGQVEVFDIHGHEPISAFPRPRFEPLHCKPRCSKDTRCLGGILTLPSCHQRLRLYKSHYPKGIHSREPISAFPSPRFEPLHCKPRCSKDNCCLEGISALPSCHQRLRLYKSHYPRGIHSHEPISTV